MTDHHYFTHKLIIIVKKTNTQKTIYYKLSVNASAYNKCLLAHLQSISYKLKTFTLVNLTRAISTTLRTQWSPQ